MPRPPEDYTMLQVVVSPDLRRRMKTMAARRGQTLRLAVVEALEAWLADRELEAKLAQEGEQ